MDILFQLPIKFQLFLQDEQKTENGFTQNRPKFNQSIKQSAAPKPPNVNSMLKNSSYTASIKKSGGGPNMADDDEDEDDTRDMTGRIRLESGYEVHCYAF